MIFPPAEKKNGKRKEPFPKEIEVSETQKKGNVGISSKTCCILSNNINVKIHGRKFFLICQTKYF